MASADYLHCVVCGCKAIYDAELNYEAATGNNGKLFDIAALCKVCAKTHSLSVVDIPATKRLSEFLECSIRTRGF